MNYISYTNGNIGNKYISSDVYNTNGVALNIKSYGNTDTYYALNYSSIIFLAGNYVSNNQGVAFGNI